ncbi:unnamed protein product [marine sediment metagenome]|uniref:SprT-like domain-containing protein n=1 Tax=marine sediment metagenome TaxID=412755 RepID=X0WGU8_9ZZZZ
MRNFDRVYAYVKKLSRAINRIHDIDPNVYVAFGPKDMKISGVCNTGYRGPDMYISLAVPVDFDLTPKHQTEIDVVLCHEYCHYIDAILSTGRERHDSGELYEKDQATKKADEHRTWRQTCKLAQNLGLWNKQFFIRLKECEYTTEITY